MKTIDFEVNKGFSYHWSGQFVPPSDDWIHMTRKLVDYELMVVTAGTLYIASEDDNFAVSPGEYLLMPPTALQHGFKHSAATFYWMHFEYNAGKNDASVTTDELSYTPWHITLPVTGKLASPDRIILLLKQLMDSDRRYREVSLNASLVTAILAEIAASSQGYKSYGRQMKGEQTFNDIKDYISWHLHESLKVSEIADYFGYNEKYLTTFFKMRSGISLKQYILSEKMDKAKALLSETNEPVSQIAYSLGWPDPHNFSNAFKHVTSLSPEKFRESYSKRNVFRV